jgi:hypothetical protein
MSHSTVLRGIPEHERNAFRHVGNADRYEPGQGRHHHVDQVREFRGQALVKISVTSESLEDIRTAIKTIRGS